MSVHPLDMSQEAFCSWLCNHEYRVFFHPSGFFDSPLSVWLVEQTGRLYGVDGVRYGLALADDCSWQPLPCWARMVFARLDAYASRPLVGYEVFHMLASVEMVLVPGGARR